MKTKTLSGCRGGAAAFVLCLCESFSAFSQTPPTLEIELLDGPEVRLSWTHPNGLVERTDQLSPADWRPLEVNPFQSNGRFAITLIALEQQQFYRLRVIEIGVLPPDPVEVASELSSTSVTDLRSATEFLYSGSNPIQTGMALGAIELT